MSGDQSDNMFSHPSVRRTARNHRHMADIMQQAQMVLRLHVQLWLCVQCADTCGFEKHAIGEAVVHHCEEKMHVATMQSIERVNSPHQWAAGSESYPGPCFWRL